MRSRNVLVTGGAGFIGSHLVETLASEGHRVTILDNFSSGSRENTLGFEAAGKARVVKGDVTHLMDLEGPIQDCDAVFHFAANPEVRLGDPTVHFETNVRGTFNVLEAMRSSSAKEIVFASSSTVYGDAALIPTPESYSPMRPISVYGAAKLSSEALISARCESYDLKGIILRYANVVGPRLSHGVIHDFIEKLRANPRELEILGDGSQRKSYLFVKDAIDATMTCWTRTRSNFEVYNVGSDDDIDVRSIADIVAEEMGLREVAYRFAEGVKGGTGWVGDVKFMRLDINKLKSLGWSQRHGSRDAVRLSCRSMITRTS